MEGVFFNVNFGYVEGLVRGYRAGLLTGHQYANLTQADSLDDLKLALQATEYGGFLANVPSPLSTSIIQQKAADKLIQEFTYIREQAVEPLSTFMDYITYGYMIDNIVLIITGTIHERDMDEIQQRLHPLGKFETLNALKTATDIESLYEMVLIDTPLAPYFKGCLSAETLDDENIEIIRNKLYKAYLEDFYRFCQTLPAPSSEIMARLLEFEGDRRTINISLNSIGTDLSRDQKQSLFPELGALYTLSAQRQLSAAEDVEFVKSVVESLGSGTWLGKIFDTGGGHKSVEDHFYAHEMELCKMAFTQQFTYSTIWAWMRAREQEVRNITWIAECIAQNQKERIDNYISVF
ncbi:V-type proton ATPase subunit d [Trichomonascus vanleenenianus]|uniref:H(+)-transporting V0 sector ATPase subunit d n=1 Tax=Trichomonascus vanleenenianus TaxID=2268995 RepID=UPI003EC9A5B0